MPEEIRDLLAGPAKATVLSIAQVELVANLTPRDDSTLDNNGVTGNTPMEMDSTHTATSDSPQETHPLSQPITQSQPLFTNPTDMAGPNPSQPSFAPNQPHHQKSQRIKEPVQILKRLPPKQKDSAGAQIPMTVVQGDSIVQGRITGQRKEKDKAETSKARERAAGCRDKEVFPTKTQNRLKKQKGPLQPKIGRVVNLHIPPKPLAFKSAVGRSRVNRAKDLTHRVELNLSSDGFYEVAVRYDHCENIAKGCGVNPVEVTQALFDDNLQRHSSEMSLGDPDPLTEGPNISFESEEELGSEEELE